MKWNVTRWAVCVGLRKCLCNLLCVGLWMDQDTRHRSNWSGANEVEWNVMKERLSEGLWRTQELPWGMRRSCKQYDKLRSETEHPKTWWGTKNAKGIAAIKMPVRNNHWIHFFCCNGLAYLLADNEWRTPFYRLRRRLMKDRTISKCKNGIFAYRMEWSKQPLIWTCRRHDKWE